MSSSLKLKLILFIVTILGLTIGIAPWSAIKMQERQLLRVSAQRLQALHEMLRETIVTTCMLTGERESIQDVAQAVSNHRGIHSLRLFDTRGVIQFSSNPEERGRQLGGAELSRYYGHAEPMVLTDSSGVVVHTLVQPMFNQRTCQSCHPATQKILGILEVGVALDRMQQQLAVLRRSAIVATAITLGVIVVGIWLALTLLIDQPLQRLVEVIGRAKHGDLSARAKMDSNDELGHLARHFDDMISKLQAAQQELERYHQEQLARADRLATIGELAAAIAHEIRNPLTGISGALSVLGRNFPNGDRRRDIIQQAHLLIDRLNKSVDSILHYSRPSSPRFHRVHVDEIVGRALSLLEGEARKAQVHLIREMGPDSDSAGKSATVYADPQQIQQVVMNLTLNAIHATAAGGRVSIRTAMTESRGGRTYSCVEIEDNGRGMTPEQTGKAFEPFFSTKAEGTGLGLPIARQIVDQHEGRISLRSTPGQGTCVRVELPAHPQAPKRAEA